MIEVSSKSPWTLEYCSYYIFLLVNDLERDVYFFESNYLEIKIDGGTRAQWICVKICYGVTLNIYYVFS